MDVLAWILLIVLFVLWLRLRGRVAGLERHIDLLLRAAPSTQPAAPVAPPPAQPSRAPATLARTRREPVPERVTEPAPVPIPAERAKAPPPARPGRNWGFEDVFGRYLPIWAGGVTLIVAGVLIVKYSIDAGLLSPAVRVVAGLLFGGALIGGAEVALRHEARVRDRRVAQSLAGAGVATLYAAILIAANLYHLASPGVAFAGLVAVTLAAAGLSLRFGAPSAVLGLVGGLAAPALVGAQSPNIPLLALYLAFIVGGLAALGRAQRWPWLGSLAILGGFGWSLVLLIGGVANADATIAVGLFTMLLGVAFPMLLVGERTPVLRLVAALAGCVQMTALVATGGFAGLAWALYGLIAAAMVWLARREPLLADAPLAGVTVGLLLVFAWPHPAAAMLAAVLAGGALVHGVPAVRRLWRTDGRLSDAAQIMVAAIGIAVVPAFHLRLTAGDVTLSGLALTGALLAGGSAALGWPNTARKGDARFAGLVLTAAALALVAASYWVSEASFAPAAAIAAMLTLLLAGRAEDRRVEVGAGVFALVALSSLALGSGEREVSHALGIGDQVLALESLVRWSVTALVAAGFARWSTMRDARLLAAGAATALDYVAVALPVPALGLALIPAAILAVLAVVALPRDIRSAALAVAGAIAAGWAVQPLLLWIGAGSSALVGDPLYVTALPALPDALFRLGAPALALAALLWRSALPERVRHNAAATLAVLGMIALHILWKHLFVLATPQGFVARGMAERTLWELLLLAAAFGAARLAWRAPAIGLAGAALAHFAWFSLVVHDPLWSVQAVGPWLLPAYAGAWAATWLVVRQLDHPIGYRVETGVRIVLMLLFAASALRQLFHGSILSVGPVVQAEDIGRSLAAILLALGFLYWGIRRADRDWRVASLVLMLSAVGKVFLFDAAGLEGLLRIVSFIALGLSLILVGWVYSRFLPDAQLTGAQNLDDSIDDQTRG